jgi:hypothetical protein
MKSKLIVSTILIGGLLAPSFLTGCATPQNPYTYQGAGLGAAVGAAIGAGVNGKNPWKGGAIGALLGGAAGGVAGEIYGRSNPYCPPNCPPQQPGYGYQSPGPGYYNQPTYGQPYYGQPYQPAGSPNYYYQEGSSPPPSSGYSQGTAAQYPSYQYAY